MSAPAISGGTVVGGHADCTGCAIVMPRARVAVCPLAVTWTVKLTVPVAVGVPEITPVPALSVRPAGRLPLASAQVYGGTPPVAASVALYGVPCVPPGSDDVVIDGGPGGDTVSVALPLSAPSV